MAPTNENLTATDEQTGLVFTLIPESRTGTICAILSGCYLLLSAFAFLWLASDTFSNHYHFLRSVGRFTDQETIPPILGILIAAFIGGALGGIVNELRSFITWHAERKAFGARFIWKGITAPWVGGALALFAIAIVTSGVSILGADLGSAQNPAQPPLAVFAIGAMAGYGSRDVSKWLDAQVKRVFVVDPAPATTTVPPLIGKSREEAEQLLIAAGLKLGVVSDEPRPNDSQVDIVVKQSPPPGTLVVVGASVNCAISRK